MLWWDLRRVERTSDQTALVQMILEGMLAPEARNVAINRVTDEALLVDLVKRGRFSG